jgi:hypothetical protein
MKLSFAGIMDGAGDHHVKWNNPVSERQISYDFSHVQNLDPQNDMNVKGLFFVCVCVCVCVCTYKKGAGERRAQWSGGWIWLKRIIWMYKNRIMKPIKLF